MKSISGLTKLIRLALLSALAGAIGAIVPTGTAVAGSGTNVVTDRDPSPI